MPGTYRKWIRFSSKRMLRCQATVIVGTHRAKTRIQSYSNLPNKRTGTIAEFSEQNLDPCLVNIFDQWKWFQLIDLIPGFTSYRGPGIKLINWNHFHWSNIFTKHGSRSYYQNSPIVPVCLFGRSEYSLRPPQCPHLYVKAGLSCYCYQKLVWVNAQQKPQESLLEQKNHDIVRWFFDCEAMLLFHPLPF